VVKPNVKKGVSLLLGPSGGVAVLYGGDGGDNLLATCMPSAVPPCASEY